MPMMVTKEPRVGDIYWLDNCEPISGDIAKTRPVIVITPPDAEKILGGILAVACTTSAYPTDAHILEIPSHPEGRVRTGLRKKTWAVLPWAVMVHRKQLVHRAGYVSGPLLDRLLKEFFDLYNAEQAKRRTPSN